MTPLSGHIKNLRRLFMLMTNAGEKSEPKFRKWTEIPGEEKQEDLRERQSGRHKKRNAPPPAS
jgi:hypothetical protein